VDHKWYISEDIHGEQLSKCSSAEDDHKLKDIKSLKGVTLFESPCICTLWFRQTGLLLYY